MKSIQTLLALSVAVTGMVWEAQGYAQSQPAAPTQSTVSQGVTVKVTPKKLDGAEWEFAVVLDTHSQELKDDLQQSAVLVVAGRELKPTRWQGPGAGGHHREGVLVFPAAAADGPIELRIQRAGEASPRVFRWDAPR